jgi:serine/threonine protein kinase
MMNRDIQYPLYGENIYSDAFLKTNKKHQPNPNFLFGLHFSVMTIFCPNYRCSQRLQSDELVVCATCGTPLRIQDKYQLTQVIRVSPEKIDGPEYSWCELFQAKCDDHTKLVIKILIIVPEAFDIPSSAADISKVRLRFEREFQLLQKSLPGICRGYEILDVPMTCDITENGLVSMRAIAMEKIDGINLDEYVQRHGVINSRQAIRWLKQLVKTLDLMHQNQVQHRDIKPSNIMVSGHGVNEQLTLVDFGVGLDCSSNQVDDETEVIGTLLYLDPLYIAGRQYLNDSDFYSLGKTFVYLLTSNPKGNLDNAQDIGHLPLSTKLKNVIQRMTDNDSTRRFATTKQLLQQLKGRRWLKWFKFAFFILIGLLSSIVVFKSFNLSTRPESPLIGEPTYVHPICQIAEINCGMNQPFLFEESDTNPFQKIIEDLSKSDDLEKRKALITKYQEILKLHRKEHHQQDRDPTGELLIYLNNAEVQYIKGDSQEIFTLLVVIPNYVKQLNISSNMLSGVAQTQKEFNDKNTGKALYIAILQEPAQDGKLIKLKEVTRKIMEKYQENIRGEIIYNPEGKMEFIPLQSKFIGVMGHYSSKSAFSVLDIYAKNKNLLISPSAGLANFSNSNITPEHLKYFARTIGNGKDNTRKIASWLQQSSKVSNCGLLEINLVYQTDDPASDSLSTEMKAIFSSTDNSLEKNTTIHPILYPLASENIKDVKLRITSELKKRLGSIKQQAKGLCSPKQVVIFFPGSHMNEQKHELIASVANTITKDAIFVSNIPLSVLNSEQIKRKIEEGNPSFYSRAYAIAPYNILDLLPSLDSSQPQKIDADFIASMMEYTMANKKTDILDIDWRQISSADAIRVFTQAIEQYHQQKNGQGTCKSPENSTAAVMIRDIIRCPDFTATGVSGQISFNGYERRGTKDGTILKYVERSGKNKGLVAVPIDYHDPKYPKQSVNQYQPLKIDALKTN